MQPRPLRTTVIGSYPFPAWLEHATAHLSAFGPADLAEMQEDAAAIAILDQQRAGLDVITDGEQTRFDFNLSFYGYLTGLELESSSPRRWGPPAHDQRGKHRVTDTLAAPRGLGVVEEYQRLARLCPPGPGRATLKASVPGPYTLTGRLMPNEQYPDRWALTEAILPLVQKELIDLVEAGCQEITVDEPSMSCYGYKEDPFRFADIFNLCFGNFKARAVAPRLYAPLYPAFHQLKVDEVHLEMASREFHELEILADIVSHGHDVCVGIVDVKSYFIEQPTDIAHRVRQCLRHAPAERLSFAPDCGLSQTARWAASQKLINMVAGVDLVRKELGLEPR
jgi:5-methyltetrahydropteroyltriglutamate--homocysteine methyltransferase